MASGMQSLSVAREPGPAREASGPSRRHFGLGALTGFFGVGIAVVALCHAGVLGPRRGTQFVAAPAAPWRAAPRSRSAAPQGLRSVAAEAEGTDEGQVPMTGEVGPEALTGTVKNFFDKGFGFIRPDKGGADVFFHRKLSPHPPNYQQFEYLVRGDKVEYEVEWDDYRGKYAASACRGPWKTS
mmetsp:Transcript_83085/g.235703  ORF Transcript_83085/g.235703 Transcript_83085/m.235703 type:complete len:183 (-) Transcript_83085:287-835(-)